MDLRDYFSIFSRRLMLIFLITLFSLGGGFSYTQFLENPKESALIFLSLGIEREPGTAYYPYATQEIASVADYFSETVQGWTKDPAFIREVNEKTGEAVSLSTRKQEKQNLLISVEASRSEIVRKGAETALLVLDEKMSRYNQATKSTFKIALSSISFSTTLPNFKLNLLLALVIGLVLGTALAYLSEYLRKVVSFESEVQTILEGEVIEKLSLRDFLKPAKLVYLKEFLKKLGGEALLLAMGVKVKNLGKIALFPEGLRGSKRNLVLFIKLGETKADDLLRVKALFKGKPYLVILK